MKDKIKKLDEAHIMPTYKRADVVFVKGEGCYVYDSGGRKYLDFLGGIATCTVGHANKEVTDAVTRQMNKLNSTSNLYYSEPQALLAEKLSELSALKKCFFSHSGADANEAAIKLAKKVTGKKGFIAFEDSFHGRTTGSLALTWKEEFKQPFKPLSPDVKFVKYGDTRELEKAVDSDTAGIFIEPIEGESGVIVPPEGFLGEVRKLCDEKGVLMIADEVQTGIGRTGKFLACEHENVKPDIVTLAKGLANGLPIGVCLSDYELSAGEHGSTLGGNNVSAAAALATIDYIEKHDLIKNARLTGAYFREQLKTLSPVKEARGKGLMLAAVLKENKAKQIVDKCLELGLVCNAPTPDIIRFLPPLIVTKAQVDECLSILKKAMS